MNTESRLISEEGMADFLTCPKFTCLAPQKGILSSVEGDRKSRSPSVRLYLDINCTTTAKVIYLEIRYESSVVSCNLFYYSFDSTFSEQKVENYQTNLSSVDMISISSSLLHDSRLLLANDNSTTTLYRPNNTYIRQPDHVLLRLAAAGSGPAAYRRFSAWFTHSLP